MKRDTSTCLVLGGAGFIGSHVTERFLRAQWRVKIVDRNPLGRQVGSDPGSEFFRTCVEDMADLPRHIADSRFVVDCMGSTRHLDALEDPERDLDLNVRSHLAVIRAFKQLALQRKVARGPERKSMIYNRLRVAKSFSVTYRGVGGVRWRSGLHS